MRKSHKGLLERPNARGSVTPHNFVQLIVVDAPKPTTMKLTVSLLVLLLPALGFAQQARAGARLKGAVAESSDFDEEPFDIDSLDQGHDLPGLRQRTLKGSKGSKGSSYDKIRISFRKRDVKKAGSSIEGNDKKEIGFTINQATLYGRNGKQVGFFTETAIATDPQNALDGSDDCTITGTWSFKPKSTRAADQIMYQASCSSAGRLAITGGTGRFMCATGQAREIKTGDQRVIYDLYVYYTC